MSGRYIIGADARGNRHLVKWQQEGKDDLVVYTALNEPEAQRVLNRIRAFLPDGPPAVDQSAQGGDEKDTAEKKVSSAHPHKSSEKRNSGRAGH